MPDLNVSLFYGFPIWNDENNNNGAGSHDNDHINDSDDDFDDEGGDKRLSPEWFREYAGKLGKKNEAFETALKRAGLQIVEYRCDGATYSDSEYFIAVKKSVVGGESGVCNLGQELPQVKPAWQKLLKEFCEKHGKNFSVSFRKPEFILCAYSAD